MKIKGIVRSYYDDYIKIECDIDVEKSTRTLWYVFDRQYECYISDDTHDAILVAALMLAMKHGEDIYIDGIVSEKLFYNINHYYMDMIAQSFPPLKKVKIFPRGLSNGEGLESGEGVITGFSGGVDSFCAVYDHLNNDLTPPNFELTHLLFNNVGSHDGNYSDIGEVVFHQRYENIKTFGEEIGLPFVKVNSNLGDFLTIGFTKSHAPRNVSVVLLLQKLIKTYYYASGCSYKDSYVGNSSDIAYLDPFALHLLSTERTACVASGGQYTRVEKTKKVTELDSSKNWLDVCVSPKEDGSNCSRCWKCSRTLVTLDILGETENYSQVFDLKTWARFRNWYIPAVILNRNNKNHLISEIRELSDIVHFKFESKHICKGLIIGLLPRAFYPLPKSYT